MPTVTDDRNAIGSANWVQAQARRASFTRFLHTYLRRCDLADPQDYEIWLRICKQIREERGWAVFEDIYIETDDSTDEYDSDIATEVY